MRAELYKAFGSRSEYLQAPVREVQEQAARIAARYAVEHEQHQRQQAEIEAHQREMERKRR